MVPIACCILVTSWANIGLAATEKKERKNKSKKQEETYDSSQLLYKLVLRGQCELDCTLNCQPSLSTAYGCAGGWVTTNLNNNITTQ